MRQAAAARNDPAPVLAIVEHLVSLNRAAVPGTASVAVLDGELYSEAIWRHLHEALRRDPAHRQAQELAADLLVASGERELMANQRKTWQLLREAAPLDPQVLLLRARDQRREDHADSAVALLHWALERGGNRSLLGLELARTNAMLDDRGAALGAYWSGAATLDELGRGWYRADLAWLVTSDSIAEFDRLAAADVEPWLRRFWRERDAASAGKEGDRLMEHFRRWALVHRDYRVVSPTRRTQFARVEYVFEGLDACVRNAENFYLQLASAQRLVVPPGDIRSREPMLDHRAFIYMRHGTPVRVVRGVGIGRPQLSIANETPEDRLRRNQTPEALSDEMMESMLLNESWLYWFDGGWRMLHLRGSKALGVSAPTTLSSYLPVRLMKGGGFAEDWRLRAEVMPEYREAYHVMAGTSERARNWGGGDLITCETAVAAAIDDQREDSYSAIASDSDTPLILDPWNAVVQSFAIGTERDGSNRLLLTYAIADTSLAADTLLDGRRLIRTDFRIVAYETGSGRVIEVDTMRRVTRTGPTEPGDHVSGYFEIPLPAGRWQIAVRAGQPVAEPRLYSLHRPVVVDVGAGPALGDLVTGIEGGAPTWPAGGEAFPLNPRAAWPEGGTIELYTELRGVPAGTAARMTIAVDPVEQDRRDGIRVTQDLVTDGTVTPIRRSIGLQTLPAGSYRLRVTVDIGGTTVSRERTVLIHRRR